MFNYNYLLTLAGIVSLLQNSVAVSIVDSQFIDNEMQYDGTNPGTLIFVAQNGIELVRMEIVRCNFTENSLFGAGCRFLFLWFNRFFFVLLCF